MDKYAFYSFRIGSFLAIFSMFAQIFVFINVKGDEKVAIDLNDLNKLDWSFERCSADQRANLLKKWSVASQKTKTSPKEVLRLYNLLSDESFDVRKSATNELILLGEINLEELQKIIGEKDELEQVSRAKQVIEQWLDDRTINVIFTRNIFKIWKGENHVQQLLYVKKLVNDIQKLPAQVNLSDKILSNMVKGNDVQRSIQIHKELFPELLKQLKEHNSSEADSLIKSFLREENETLVIKTIELIGFPSEDPKNALELIRLAEGKNKTIVISAMSYLSGWGSSHEYLKEIEGMLKKYYSSEDEELALHASILSCRAGDSSGFPVLLKATKSKNQIIVLAAITELGNDIYMGRNKDVVPFLIPHLQTDNLEILVQTIDAFGNCKVAGKHVLPFLNHQNKNVVFRTITALKLIEAVEAIETLETQFLMSDDKIEKKYIYDTLKVLKKLRK